MKRFYTILFIAFIFSFSLTAKVNSAKPEVRVLFISSYSSAYPTFSQQYEGVKSVIGHERNSVLDVEFMDCKDIVNDPVNIDLFRKLLAYRMSKLDRYQVILVADDDAFQFAIREQDKLFKGIPIVFLGVDNVQAALRQNQNPQMTGVVEKVSLKETVDLMIKLFPRCQQIYAITDSTISGQEQNSNLENLIANVNLKKSFKIINLSTMTYADFAKSLQAIPQSDPVLYLSAFIDKSGKSITFDNSMKLIRHNLSSPIFTLWDHGFGDGLFGGKVVSHYEQGRAAAQIAKSILEGKTPADIPVISSSPNKFIFDYREVKKHNICLSRLPRGSSVLFKPYSFFEQNKTIVLLGSSVFILMAVLLYVLIAKRIKMKHIMDVMLQEKNKAQIADKLKSAFLANMSHEIRTPLNAIVGFSELLQNTDDPGEKAKFVEIINQNNDTLLRLVGDILDLSKIESGLLELHPEHFDMVELYDSLYQMNKSRWNKPEVNFEGVDPYVNCFVYLDKSRIRQIWTNFLTNAIKYTAKGKISMGYEYVLEGLKIYVTDTGIGIPDDKRDRVFQRFEKFDTFAKGTGLGLSICKAIVDQCKGKIGFESVYGEGSTFWAWIPCEAEINLAQMPPEPIKITKDMPIVEISSCKSPCSILAAEDNDGNYMLLKVFLKDYKLTRAVNGAEAVGLASHNKYDVILMDMKMPIMDGLEATAKIREFDKKTPIVALTANAFDSDKAAAMNAGCTDFLSKPFEKSELIAVLNKALSS